MRRLLAFATIVGLVVAFAASPALAQATQMYLLGVTNAQGSISSPQFGVDVVYLRWDTVEGDLPSDVVELSLVRDEGTGSEQLLATFSDPHGVMSAAQIQSLYGEPGQDRRRQEMAYWLDERLSASVTGANLGTYVNSLIDPMSADYERFFSEFASRVDINVARARHRGFIDLTAPVGLHKYTLMASNGVVDVQVGEVEVDVGVRKPIPQATQFSQVDLGRCDAPEQGKDQGSIALVWEHPGSTITDRYGAALMVAGYDLYRSEEPICDGCFPTAIDVAAEASLQGHTALGTPIVPGYVRVNEQPIVLAGRPDPVTEPEQRYKGYNDPFYQVFITAEQVEAMGLKPGDRIPLYLVARDFTGNYGDTAILVVTIPDNTPPPAPWNVTTQAKTWVDPNVPGDVEEMRVVWDQVNVVNYHDDYGLDRIYCNLDTARFEKELRYVPEGGDCENDPQIKVELDVVKYLVYRFDSQGDAMRFVDSDGDGYSDEHERAPIFGLGPEFSMPGDACDPTVFPADPTLDKKVAEVQINMSPDQVQRPSGRIVMQYIDPDVPMTPDTIYWYRIASVSPDGGPLPGGLKVGELSAPIRGLYHDRDLPLRGDCPGIDLVTVDRTTCTYDALYIGEDPPGAPVTARDESSDQAAASIEILCQNPLSGFVTSVTAPITGNPALGEERTATLTQEDCDGFLPVCGNALDTTLVFRDAQGNPIASEPLGEYVPLTCPIGTTILVDDCQTRSVRPGETLTGPPSIANICADADICTSVYQEIGGKSYKLFTHCLPDPPPTLNLPGLSGDICLSYTLHDQNNNVSAKAYFPCFHLPTSAPDAPQAVAFTFDLGSSSATMSFVPPEQPVAGTLLEWRQAGEDQITTVFNAHEGLTARDGVRAQGVTLPTPPPTGEDQEEWCFRARAVTRDGKVSPWSPTRCDLRLPAGVPIPEYMPWPKIVAPEETLAASTSASYLAEDKRLVILMGQAMPALQTCELSYIGETCDGQVGGGLCLVGPDQPFLSQTCDDFCDDIQTSLTETLGFVVYRQWGVMDDDPNPSAFQQVSPMIDLVACSDFDLPNTGIGGYLGDPYMKLIEFTAPHPWAATGPRLVFLDRAPHIESRWYRYQLVYFNGRGEIEGYGNSNWVQAQ